MEALKEIYKRVKQEHFELKTRVIKLSDFVYSKKIELLPTEQQILLVLQLQTMEQYQRILAYRLEHFRNELYAVDETPQPETGTI